MAHIQRRCTACAITVPKGRQSCPRCGGRQVSYRVRYVDPDGTERSRSFKRRANAEAFETSVDHSIRAGAYVDPSAGQVTVRAYLEDWRAQQAHWRPKTAASTRTRFRTMVYRQIGSQPLVQVKPSTVRTWQKTLLEQGYAASTIRGVRGVLAGAFNDAVLDRLIASSPFDGVKAPEQHRPKVTPRTVAQVRAGQAACPDDRYAAIVPVAAGTGLRQGELFGLTVDRIDFLRRTITVDRQLVGRARRTPLFGPPKSKASDRVIPVGEHTIATLAAHLAAYPARPHELVFRTARGTPITRTVFGRVWRPIAAAMGLGPGEGLHQLRHFYASLLIADGLNVLEVQARLGHASAQETLDTYAHLFPGVEDRTRSAVDRAFATDDSGATRESGAAASTSE